ncbi:hypothetical protein AJ88_07910 [Mesorhizobium amorphae CCBAU 01583]|nr:hypothetical protein AJ88_07910 [Mesorhizobium amorphae CCBAU 01583]
MASGALALAYLGEVERARGWVSRALVVCDDSLEQYNVACAMAQIGEIEKAFELLEACVSKIPAQFLDWIRNDTDLEPLHAHLRYDHLIAAGERRLSINEADAKRVSSLQRAIS